MENKFTILVADRNRHVRDFLRRELMLEGYEVLLAKDGREVLAMIGASSPPHLLILDLEIPFLDGVEILNRLKNLNPPLPVVVYTLLAEHTDHPVVQTAAAFIEKPGDIDRLKLEIGKTLKYYYPQRTTMTAENLKRKMDTSHEPE